MQQCTRASLIEIMRQSLIKINIQYNNSLSHFVETKAYPVLIQQNK